MGKHNGKLPIEDGVDVISVRSLAFKRFLDIAKALEQKTAVVTDNDGNYEKNITKKYKDYENIDSITIFADNREELNTLEPQFVDANKNNLKNFCKAIDIKYNNYKSFDLIVKYMENKNNKTKWALYLFDTTENIEYPEYINKVIAWCDEE